MPRDSSGNYTLPSGNPVQTGTIIESDWANDTMGDLGNEMTDSLSRSGQGGMLAPMEFVDGSAATPSISFVQEPTLGWYRKSPSVIGLAALGSQQMQYDALLERFTIMSGSQPLMQLAASLPGGEPRYQILDTNGFERASLRFDDVDGEVAVQRRDVSGGLETELLLTDDGNAQVNGVAPVADADLTRKDYSDTNDQFLYDFMSDNLFTRYLAGYLNTGLHNAYNGDCNDINVNSNYLVVEGVATNLPSDFGTAEWGFLTTDMYFEDTGWLTQTLVGMNGANKWKVWMRHEEDTTWSAWIRVVDSNVVDAVAGGSSSAFTFTGIPADCRQITLSGVNVRMPVAGTSLAVRWGANGSVDDTGYAGRVSEIVGATAAEAASNAAWASLNVTSYGASVFLLVKVTLDRVGTGNLWLMTAQVSDITQGRVVQANAEHTAIGGPLDTIQLLNLSGNFQSGTVQIRYKT